MEIYNNSVSSILLDSLKINTSSTQKSNGTQDAISKILTNKYLTNSMDGINDSTSVSTVALNNFKYEKEGNIITGLDLIKATSDALDEMTENLSFLKSVLADSDSYGDKSGFFSWLEEQSDAIIDQITDIYNNTEYNGVKIFSGIQEYSSNAMLDNYQNFVLSLGTQDDIYAQLIINTKINLEGLQDIKGPSIYDDEYETKLDEIIAEINAKRDELNNKSQILYEKAQDIYKEYDLEYKNIQAQSSKDLQLQIINDADETLKSVMNGLSSEILLQF